MKEIQPQPNPRQGLPEQVQVYLSYGDLALDPKRTNQERVLFDMKQLEMFNLFTKPDLDALVDYGQKMQEQIVAQTPIRTVDTLGDHI